MSVDQVRAVVDRIAHDGTIDNGWWCPSIRSAPSWTAVDGLDLRHVHEGVSVDQVRAVVDRAS